MDVKTIDKTFRQIDRSQDGAVSFLEFETFLLDLFGGDEASAYDEEDANNAAAGPGWLPAPGAQVETTGRLPSSRGTMDPRAFERLGSVGVGSLEEEHAAELLRFGHRVSSIASRDRAAATGRGGARQGQASAARRTPQERIPLYRAEQQAQSIDRAGNGNGLTDDAVRRVLKRVGDRLGEDQVGVAPPLPPPRVYRAAAAEAEARQRGRGPAKGAARGRGRGGAHSQPEPPPPPAAEHARPNANDAAVVSLLERLNARIEGLEQNHSRVLNAMEQLNLHDAKSSAAPDGYKLSFEEQRRERERDRNAPLRTARECEHTQFFSSSFALGMG